MKRARLQLALALATLFGAAFATEPTAAAGPDPAAEAQRLVGKLDAPETRTVVADPLGKAKDAQRRALNARGAGDLHHATELDTLALTWAQVADDLVRTAASEKKAAELQTQVSELEQKAVRTQALIEQTIARRGRAEQNLANAEAALKPASKPAPSKAAASKAAAGKTSPAGTTKPGKSGGLE